MSANHDTPMLQVAELQSRLAAAAAEAASREDDSWRALQRLEARCRQLEAANQELVAGPLWFERMALVQPSRSTCWTVTHPARCNIDSRWHFGAADSSGTVAHHECCITMIDVFL